MRRVFVANLVGPRRVGNPDAVRPPPRQRRRLGADQCGLLCGLQTTVDALDAPGAVHGLLELAELLGLGSGSVDDGLGLRERGAFHAGEGSDFVARIALGSSRQVGGSFELAPNDLPLLCGRSFFRLQGALDGDGFAEGEVLAKRVFGVLAARDLIEVDDGDRNLFPTELLRRQESALARDEQVIGRDDDGVKQSLGHAGGERGDVAHVLAVALADTNRVEREAAWAAAHDAPAFCSAAEMASAAAFVSGKMPRLSSTPLNASTPALPRDSEKPKQVRPA